MTVKHSLLHEESNLGQENSEANIWAQKKE